MNGRELADRVRSEMPAIKVLFMSGYAGDALGRRGVLEDGLAFLPKPFTPAALLQKVRDGAGLRRVTAFRTVNEAIRSHH